MMNVDCNGTDLVGCNEDGYWMGTENAWLVLGDHQDDGPELDPRTPTLFVMDAWLAGESFQLYCVASEEGVPRAYLKGMGCTDIKLTLLKVLRKSRRRFLPYSYFQVSEGQRAKLLG
jgi:hypothetical protein